ncbi:MAG: ornithine carbamoyltransferase [Planctomycetales bacterium]
MRHLITLADLRPAEVERVFAIATDLKSKYQQGKREPLLPGRTLALLFEKPSLRTRTSFECAMTHLGGSCMFLGSDCGFGARESIADFTRVLSQYVDVIVARTFQHQTQLELAQHSSCSVINGLSDQAHPCQALADVFTIQERVGRLRGHSLTFVGDGNNVAKSLAWACGLTGMKLVLAAPEQYQFDEDFLKDLREKLPDAEVEQIADPAEAVRDAVAVYTDVWASMGQESETERRREEFAPYQVNAELMAAAPEGAYFMHCLPAHRGEEVTDEVIDASNSIVVEQAANRMHAQKGLLAWMLTSQS